MHDTVDRLHGDLDTNTLNVVKSRVTSVLWFTKPGRCAPLGWSVKFDVQGLTSDTPKHLHMLYVPCMLALFVKWALQYEQSTYLCDEQTVHVINAAYGLDPKGRYDLSSYTVGTDFCWSACLPACLPAWLCSAAFSVTCPDLHTCLSLVHLCLRMLVRTTVRPQAGTASPSLLSRTCCELLMSGGAQLLLTVNISMQEKPSQSCVSCVCVCVSVLYRGCAEYGRTA